MRILRTSKGNQAGRPLRPNSSDRLADSLQTVNRMIDQLGPDLDTETARLIAETVWSLLGGEGVAVTDLSSVVAVAGTVPETQPIDEQTISLLEDRRWDRPTAYEIDSSPSQAMMASVISVNQVSVGTIHIATNDVSRSTLRSLQELTELVSSQLVAAGLKREASAAAIAELRALRIQISPHFIHNSLTSVAGLINQDPKMARELLATFAEFLRSSFRTDAEFQSMAEELRLVEIYLQLEQARFGDRFEISVSVAPETLSVQLPFLSVQPIVENAIRHGLEHRVNGGKLTIKVADAQNEATIVIEDNGVGTDPDELYEALQGKRSSQHIGVLAVDERLRSAFGPEYGLVISTGSDLGTEVKMRIPKYSRG